MDKSNIKKEITEIVSSFTKDNAKDFEAFLKKSIGDKKIVLYGAGSLCKYTVSMLSNFVQYPIEYILDINADNIKTVEGINVISPSDTKKQIENRNDVIVIVSIVIYTERLKRDVFNVLEQLGYKFVIHFSDLWYFKESRFVRSAESAEQYFSKNMHNILKTVDMLEDEHSLQIYLSFIKAVFYHDYKLFSPMDNTAQYFDDDIKAKKGKKRYIDCGTYDGKNIKDLLDKYGAADCIAAFEPDSSSFNLLCSFIEKNAKFLPEQTLLFPCGVFSDTKKLSFNDSSRQTSKISLEGNNFIQCVALDQVLPMFSPTFIKMDIEGAELDAIKGAKNLICKHKPDLAICIYHLAEDIWEIPSLLNSWDLGYIFYLRTYSYFGFETVLYAVCD